jgi:hypothetical protein
MAADHRSGRLRRLGRIAWGCLSGSVIGSIVLVALYRALLPPATPLIGADD